MKCHAVLIATALALTVTAGANAREIDPTTLHVRSLDAAGTSLLAGAQQKSATVRDLVRKLDASNLVAYVQVAPLPRYTPESGLAFVGASNRQRYVMITIAEGADADRQMELLGHELQHASEVARTSWVTSDTHFQTLMSLVGWRDTSRATGYETSAANAIERQVRREVKPEAR